MNSTFHVPVASRVVGALGSGMSRQPGICVGGSLPLPSGPPRAIPQVSGGDNPSEVSVCDAVNRYRVSILAFDDRARLGRAIKDLIENGLEAGQLCLAGLPKSLDALQVPDELGHQAKSELADMMTTDTLPLRLDGVADLVARAGPRTMALLKQPGQATATFDWMQEERRRELAHYAVNGAVILLVSADNAEQLSASAGVLLRHGRHNLQTHVFTLPANR